MTTTTPDFAKTNVPAVIPKRATLIRLVANGIDGWPPFGDKVLSIGEFLAEAEQLQMAEGAGEWTIRIGSCGRSAAAVECSRLRSSVTCAGIITGSA